MRDLPSGTVTFLFTDVEGSTRLLLELGAEEYAEALSEHRRIMREACAAHEGAEVDTQGDAFFFAFPTAPSALQAAQAITERLKATSIQVRIGIHTGTPLVTEEGYVGADVHLAARIAAAGHGGQILVSASAAQILAPRASEPPALTFVDLGEHRLADLSAPQHIFQLGDGEFPPLKTLYQTNLPIPTTPFLGREFELQEVVDFLHRKDVRLLTLTGTGGTGKTRVAMQAAAEVADEYEHGVWWVELAALRDATIVLEQVARTLGAKSTLASHIAANRLLLVLDNFEQVIEARLDVAELITSCPNLDVLVTSREPLHITGEQAYAVPALKESEAIDLFHARATAALAHFVGDGVVADICRRLENLPLAIELAAARVKALTTDAILSRLEQRLALLTGGARDLPERQRTLRATIAWSHELLSPEERLLFARLSVFAGGFTLEAAEEVATADLNTLHSLVDKSLVGHDGGRYSMLETIREYALEQLEEAGEADTVRERHAHYFATLARRGAPARDRIGVQRVELDNFRAALAWLRASGSGEFELRLAISLFDLWIVGGYSGEGRRAVEGALATSAGHPSDLRAKALKAAGDLALDHGDFRAANELLEQALSLYRELGGQQNVARCLTDLGHVAKGMRDHGRAEALFAESITLARGLDDADVLAEALLNYGDFLVSKGDFVRAELMCRESLALYQELGFSLGVASCLFSLALACLHQDRQQEAFGLLQECLSIFRDFDYAVGIASSFEGLAAIAALRGRGEKAARLLGAAEALFETVGASLEPAELALHERTAADIRDELGEAALERFWADGRTMSLDRAIEHARDPID